MGKIAPGETTQAEWLPVGAGHCQGSSTWDFVSPENGPSWKILNHSVVEQKFPNIILLNSNTWCNRNMLSCQNWRPLTSCWGRRRHWRVTGVGLWFELSPLAGVGFVCGSQAGELWRSWTLVVPSKVMSIILMGILGDLGAHPRAASAAPLCSFLHVLRSSRKGLLSHKRLKY